MTSTIAGKEPFHNSPCGLKFVPQIPPTKIPDLGAGIWHPNGGLGTNFRKLMWKICMNGKRQIPTT